ncbi:hypothetical protein ACFQAT_27905 [Undibacterium arcticum]|uniref:hypothetical protein n=1 Tax=Undibacterium arcticum TaxID=1762892 RepID=UPI003608B66E
MSEKLNKYLFTTAFFLGAVGVVWVAIGFFGSSVLALAMTTIIGAVYVFGALELRQFRQASTTLATALMTIPEILQTSSSGWSACMRHCKIPCACASRANVSVCPVPPSRRIWSDCW